jgi:hypothetical protein
MYVEKPSTTSWTSTGLREFTQERHPNMVMNMKKHSVRRHTSAGENDFTMAKNSVNRVPMCLPESTFFSLALKVCIFAFS